MKKEKDGIDPARSDQHLEQRLDEEKACIQGDLSLFLSHFKDGAVCYFTKLST